MALAATTTVGQSTPFKLPLHSARPFEDPLPQNQVFARVVDGVIQMGKAFQEATAKFGRRGSFTIWLPAGAHQLTYTGFYVDALGSETGCIAIMGSSKGHTRLLDTGGVFHGNSNCWGTFRVGNLSARGTRGIFVRTGTGGYNARKVRLVLDNIDYRYGGDYVMMMSAERESRAINDEIWMKKCYFAWNMGSHLVYIDSHLYAHAEDCTFLGGGNHAFKCVARNTFMKNCLVSNVDPVTRLPHHLAPGTPNAGRYARLGQVYYGKNSPASLLAIGKGRAINCTFIKGRPAARDYQLMVEQKDATGQVVLGPDGKPVLVPITKRISFSDGGAYVIARQARWAIGKGETMNPTNAKYWQAARAAGIDDPENPYLLPHIWFWENCKFIGHNERKPGRGTGWALGNQGTHPLTAGAGSTYDPVVPNFPDLWLERSRDYYFGCTFEGLTGETRFAPPTRTSKLPNAAESWAREDAYKHLIWKKFDRKPDWWPEPTS